MKKAYQLSSLGVPLKHLGVREFPEFRWDKLMAWYKSRGIKPRWELVKEEKPPVKRKTKEEKSMLDVLKEHDESQNVEPNKDE